MECEVAYLTFPLAEFLGVEEYVWLSTTLPYTAFVGDWMFTEALYGGQPQADANYVREILCETWRLDDVAVRRIMRARAWCEPFLDHCLRTVEWAAFDIIGFTSTFEQNLASLALAQRLKQAHPQLVVVFGGANWEAEMGLALHRRFGFVDVVCSGEADASFPPW